MSLVSYKRNFVSKIIANNEIFEVAWNKVKMTSRSPVLFSENHYKWYKNGYKIKFIFLDSLMSLVSNEINDNIFWILYNEKFDS